MSEIYSFITQFLLVAAWQIAVITVAAIAVSSLLSRTRARVREKFWNATLIVAVIAPFVSLAVNSHSVAKETVFRISVLAIPRAFTEVFRSASASEISSFWSANMFAWVGGLYLVFLILSVLALAISFGSLQKLRASGHQLGKADRIGSLVDLYSRRFDIPPPEVRSSKEIDTAVTLGFLSPIILLSTRLTESSADSALQAALAHELAHVRRRDFLWNIVVETITLPVTFHPGIWFLRSQVRRYRELATDEVVTEHLMGRREYARSLLAAAHLGLETAHIRMQLAFGLDRLEERIRWQTGKVRFSGRRIQLLALMIAFLLASAPALAAVLFHARSSFGQQETGSKESEGYHVGDPGVTNPVLVTQTIPSYTEEAKEAEIEGLTILNCLIGVEGRAADCEIRRELGFGLDESAAQEIEETWRFKPALKDGAPVPVRATIEIQFTLTGTELEEIAPEEAENLIIKSVEFIGSEEAVQAARGLIEKKEQSRFSSSKFIEDKKRLSDSNEISLVEARLSKDGSGDVLIRYTVRLRE